MMDPIVNLVQHVPSESSTKNGKQSEMARGDALKLQSAHRFLCAENVDENDAEMHTSAYVCNVCLVGKFVTSFFRLIL